MKQRTCPTGKKRFRYKEQVVRFLHHAQNARRDASELGGTTTHRSVRAYQCSACRGWHTTSQTALAA